MVLPSDWQEQRAGLAQGRQESARGRDEDRASGGDTARIAAERHRGLLGETEVVWRATVVLRAEGFETLKCVRPRNERNDSRILQPDVIIGWAGWDKVQLFAMSGWAIPGQALPGATAPATKWHLRVNLRGIPPVYLNVQLDPMRKRTTITHEAAVREGETFHSFYMLFART